MNKIYETVFDGQVATGLLVTVRSLVIKLFLASVLTKEKIEVLVDFDGEFREMTLQEFKSLLFPTVPAEVRTSGGLGAGECLYEPNVITCGTGRGGTGGGPACNPSSESTPALERPQQALRIARVAAKLAVLNGTKKITIREGLRDYRKGKVILCDEVENWATMKMITKVQWKTLGEVTYWEMNADGFDSVEDMISGLKKFYPQITLESLVTVIEWE